MTNLSLLKSHDIILKAKELGIIICNLELTKIECELKPFKFPIISDNHMDYIDIENDDKLPMSKRSYGWYNKFSKNSVFKRK